MQIYRIVEGLAYCDMCYNWLTGRDDDIRRLMY